MQFTFNEGHIQLPSQWQDQSMQVLVSTDNSGINLVIKAAILEEFLHGTQEKLGIAEKLGRYGLGSAETHVKDFMIRHKKCLGYLMRM